MWITRRTDYATRAVLALAIVDDERPLEDPDDALERQLLGRVVEAVAPARPPLGAQDPRRPQLRQDLLEHGDGRGRGGGALLDLPGPLVVGDGEGEHGPGGVVGAAGDPHRRGSLSRLLLSTIPDVAARVDSARGCSLYSRLLYSAI